MFCKQCGKKLDEGTKFCNGCGAQVEGTTTKESKAKTSTTSSDNIKIWKILAYLGPLFLVGMFVKEKDDKSLKFHVGQGILACIIDVVVALLNNLVIAKIFRKEVTILGFGTGVYETSGLGVFIMWALGLCTLAVSAYGIYNVIKNEDKEIPVIGKYAFYK